MGKRKYNFARPFRGVRHILSAEFPSVLYVFRNSIMRKYVTSHPRNTQNAQIPWGCVRRGAAGPQVAKNGKTKKLERAAVPNRFLNYGGVRAV